MVVKEIFLHNKYGGKKNIRNEYKSNMTRTDLLHSVYIYPLGENRHKTALLQTALL